MKIRNEEERAMFEKTIDRCRRMIWLVTTRGDSYDLNKPAERGMGISQRWSMLRNVMNRKSACPALRMR